MPGFLWHRRRRRSPATAAAQGARTVTRKVLSSGRTMYLISDPGGRTRSIDGFDSLEWLYNQPPFAGPNH